MDRRKVHSVAAGLARKAVWVICLLICPLMLGVSPQEKPKPDILTDLETLAPLQQTFEKDSGKVRLVLLLSPT